jgi:hypothetical protein
LDKSAIIFNKLELFIKKYYTNELLRGALFFIGIGLLYFLFIVFIEYFLWLQPIYRTFLFFIFVSVELFLLVRFILFPLFKLTKFKNGIDFTSASLIIGKHFPEVGDKLLNFVQLSNDSNQSELLLASIDQKADNLQPIPFSNAIDFKSNIKYLPFALLPVLIYFLLFVSGNSFVVTEGFNRVVHFKKTYAPPAPFVFQILNNQLSTEQQQDFVLLLKTKGKVIPENVAISIDDETYFMESSGLGLFKFTFSKPTADISFHFEANDVLSKTFLLDVVSVPTISNFEMYLNFPSYLKKKNQTISGTGNALVPEGTTITWKIATLATSKVDFVLSNASFPFTSFPNSFSYSKNIIQDTDYQIVTSNSSVSNHEKLTYHLSVIKDAYPSITVSTTPDSIKASSSYLLGQVSDDFGLSKLQVVYFPSNKPNQVQRGTLAVKNDLFDQFVFSFPGNFPVQPGTTYDYYFEIFDNDALHNFKSARSSVFSYHQNTESENESMLLKDQNSAISGLEKSLKTQQKQLSEIDKLQQLGKEKETLEYKEQQKVDDFLERQLKQDKIMQDFSEKMKDNLDKFHQDKSDPDKELLQKRLDNLDKDFEKNKKLLDELQKLNDKLNKDELFEKMDQLKQQTQNQSKSLEQLVELTKQFYVEKKAQQLADKLNSLSDKQNKLAISDKDNTAPKQLEINKEFDEIKKELNDLDKDNKELKSPLDLPNPTEKEKSIDDDLQKATDDLKKEAIESAKPKQKNAAKKMKQMSSDMQDSMESGEQEQLEEDVAMLRQILDNLVAFSFSQENVMKQFKGLKRGSPAFNKFLKNQQDLKQQFKHVDDSLFAMSLRNPKIAENITKEVCNVQYNIERSIDNLADANVSKGVYHQQYAVSSSNKLADFLADVLTNMQASLSMSGKGKGKGKPSPGKGSGGQLPDIIMKQDGLSEQLQKGIKKGDKPGSKPGQGSDGKGSDSGSKGKSGDGKQNGNSSSEDGEGDAQSIMEIYKQQQQLRDALQNELNKNGLGGSGQSAIEQMKQIEKQLLNKGFTNEVLQKMLNLKYELLKLDKAVQQQGEEKKRQAEVSKAQFSNKASALPASLQDYLKSIEILNRQTLPLRSNFNQKVQEYFKEND